MAIYEHAAEFAGKPVRNWKPGQQLAQASETNYRFDLEFEEEEAGQRLTDKLTVLLAEPEAAELYGLVVGNWCYFSRGEASSAAIVQALAAAHNRLPKLRALFIGDIISEECEISWIQQSDLAPLLAAYPALEHFRVRGGERLSLGALTHAALKSLIVESGGLSVEIVRQVAAANLSSLEHLELWLGTDDYGADATVADLAPILSGQLFPRLRYLGLRDSDITDDIAKALLSAPLLERLATLDLSLGTLTDEGAAALLANPAINKLTKLDLHHHFCSAELMEKLEQLGPAVDLKDQQKADEYDGRTYRYVAVGE